MIIRYIYNGQKYTSLYALRQAIWQTESKVYGEPKSQEDFDSLGLKVTLEEYDPEQEYLETLSEEEKTVYNLDKTKNERAEAVAAIKVTVDGMVFDGDEIAQSRMARALTAAEAAGQTSTVWVLADNTIATVTKAQLAQALALSMQEMGKMWTKPYEEKAE